MRLLKNSCTSWNKVSSTGNNYDDFQKVKMDLDEMKILLTSTNVKTVTKSLTEIRTSVMKSESGIAKLLDQGFVALLVPLLDKTNIRLLDLVLSILANLLLEPQARQQIVEEGGLQKLTAILQNIEVQKTKDKSFDLT